MPRERRGKFDIKCPPSHPIAIIKSDVDTFWDLSVITDGPRRLTWSQGDDKGFGFHVDIVNGKRILLTIGWDQGVLETLSEKCIPGPFYKNNCAELKKDGVMKNRNAPECSISGNQVPSETCTGTIDSLCGNNGSPSGSSTTFPENPAVLDISGWSRWNAGRDHGISLPKPMFAGEMAFKMTKKTENNPSVFLEWVPDHGNYGQFDPIYRTNRRPGTYDTGPGSKYIKPEEGATGQLYSPPPYQRGTLQNTSSKESNSRNRGSNSPERVANSSGSGTTSPTSGTKSPNNGSNASDSPNPPFATPLQELPGDEIEQESSSEQLVLGYFSLVALLAL